MWVAALVAAFLDYVNGHWGIATVASWLWSSTPARFLRNFTEKMHGKPGVIIPSSQWSINASGCSLSTKFWCRRVGGADVVQQLGYPSHISVSRQCDLGERSSQNNPSCCWFILVTCAQLETHAKIDVWWMVDFMTWFAIQDGYNRLITILRHGWSLVNLWHPTSRNFHASQEKLGPRISVIIMGRLRSQRSIHSSFLQDRTKHNYTAYTGIY